MWEAILRNRRRSRFLIGIMGAVLVTLGFMIGAVADPNVGGPVGAVIALLYWLVLLCIALTGGGQALLLGARARPIGKEDAPQLWNVVEEMTIASGLGKMPQVYVVEEESPNAFAVGPTPDKAVVAVTSGLLKRLSRDELQGVIAHEIGHVKNLDVRFMTIAVVMLASITVISDLFLRSLWFGAGRRRSSKIDPRAQAVILAVTVVLAVLAPLLARLLYMACSRQREYLADASAARFTRYPEGLASALEKIAVAAPSMKGANRAIAPLYIVNPLEGGSAGAMFSTHPPTAERIKILRAMGGGAGWVDYDKAFRGVHGGESCIGKQTLSSEGSVAIREATPDGGTKSEMVERIREVDALLGRLDDLITIPCACGVQIRVPNNVERDTFPCPRCGREHPMPRAGESGAARSAAGSPRPHRLRYERKIAGWEAFKCGCGKAVQLSPAFDAPIVRCRGCGSEIEVVGPKRVPAGAP
jgi:heat shock protein HtpX